MTTSDDPMWGCAHPGCTEHPATGGGPIFRTSPKGQAFEGLCGKHLNEDIADSEPAKVGTDRFARTDPFLDELEAKGYVVLHKSEVDALRLAVSLPEDRKDTK